MSTAFKKNIIVILFLAVIRVVSVFGQDTTTGSYFDFLFNDYIELETSVLDIIESGEIDSQQLAKIDSMLLKSSEENRNDISSRLKMLRFAAKSEIIANERALNAEVFIAEMAEAEKKRQAHIAAAESNRNIAGITIGTAVTAGAVFTVSSLVSQDYYEKYLQTEIADQAAFYLFWWQFLDNISAASAAITIISSATAGILAATL